MTKNSEDFDRRAWLETIKDPERRARLEKQPDPDQLFAQSGLRRFQKVRCKVTGHRGRFGVEVVIVDPVSDFPAFIDFVLLADDGPEHVEPEDYPAVGTVLDAVTLDFMPDGELRLDARP